MRSWFSIFNFTFISLIYCANLCAQLPSQLVVQDQQLASRHDLGVMHLALNAKHPNIKELVEQVGGIYKFGLHHLHSVMLNEAQLNQLRQLGYIQAFQFYAETGNEL